MDEFKVGDIVKTIRQIDDRDLELAKIVSTICYDEIYVTDAEPDEFGVWNEAGIIATGRSDKIMRSYEYMAANVEAANIDLKAWTT